MKKTLLVLFLLQILTAHTSYYKLLEIPRNFTEKQLKKKYKKKLLSLHPDKFHDEKKKKIAKKKFTEVQEAFETLSDPELKRAYDTGGLKKLEKVKKRKNEEEQYKNSRKANQEKHFGNQENKISDILKDSKIPLITPSEISKFGRRITSWLIFFYKNDDKYLKLLTPPIERLFRDFEGVYKIVRINCEIEDEFCREFLVYGTPKLQVFPSFSGMEAKEFDFHNYLDFLEKKEDKKFLGFLSREISKTVEDFVIFLRKENIKDFERKKNKKIVLITNKKKTPVLWKVLSKEFKSYLEFGVIKENMENGFFVNKLKIQKLPAIFGFSKKIENGVVFEDDFSPHKIRNFLRKIIKNENTEKNFFILDNEDFLEDDNCRGNDKKICFIFFENENLTKSQFSEIAENLQNIFPQEHLKFLFLDKKFYQKNFFEENKLKFYPKRSFFIYKANVNKGKVIGFNFKEEFKRKLENMNLVVENIMSKIIGLEKLEFEIEKYYFDNKEL